MSKKPKVALVKFWDNRLAAWQYGLKLPIDHESLVPKLPISYTYDFVGDELWARRQAEHYGVGFPEKPMARTRIAS